MIRSISTAIDDPDCGQDFICDLLDSTRKDDVYVYLTLMTAGPMVSSRIAPLGGLYIPENELRGDALAAITNVRAATRADEARMLINGIYGDVAWLAHDLRNDDIVADVAVIGPEDVWSVPWLRHRAIETLLLASGTPLMLLPHGRTLPPLRHIVLGWKPSPQAVHAARSIVALAEPGAKVEIVTVGTYPPASDAAPNARCGIAEFLERHGLKTECHWAEGPYSDEVTLQDFALGASADTLAVGGFGHSRIREIVLGGVTRALVQHCRLPVMMAH